MQASSIKLKTVLSVILLTVSASMNMDHINASVKKDLFLTRPIARPVLILTSVT